ncbi:MAG: hypothetical protein GY863_17870 [bacterium]|nr:hypothetical protein [bacterium]
MKIKALIPVLLLFLVSANISQAQSINIGPRAGLYLEDTDISIGGEVDVELLSVLGLHIITSVETIFADKNPDGLGLDSKWYFSCNAAYDMISLGLGDLYVGGGLGVFRTKIEANSKKETDIAVNILGGIRFNVLGQLKPFANARITFSEDTSIILEGGFHFQIF